jgi:hypothetical protein
MKKISFYILVLISSFIIVACTNTDTNKDYVKKVELNEETIAVGIYKATGFEYPNIKYIAEALNIDAGIVYVTLSDDDVLKTKLTGIDVLIFPALKGDQVIDKLDDEISEIFKDFISRKGAIGFTNGCSLLINNIDCQSLNIINVDLDENNRTENFSGLVNFELSNEGKKIFPELAEIENLIVGVNSPYKFVVTDTVKVQVLGGSITDSENLLFISSKYENGNIFFTNGQPEITPGMRWMIPRIVRWTYNKEFVYYDKNVFRPDLFAKEVMLDQELNSKLETLLKQLDEGNKSEIIAAMDELQNIYPMIAAEKVRLLLIEKNDDIKLRAAKYLVDIEYTLAIKDFKKTIKKVRSKKVKEQLKNYMIELDMMTEQN